MVILGWNSRDCRAHVPRRFRRNFRDTPWVRVPTVHWEFSSTRVLTLEYLPGKGCAAKHPWSPQGVRG